MRTYTRISFPFLLFFLILSYAPTFAQVPTVDPLSVTTPMPTADPNDTTRQNSDTNDIPVSDELSIVDATRTPTPIPIPDPPTDDSLSDLTHGFNRTRYYTVRPEDTLLSVALESGINIEEMWCVVAPTFTGREPLVIGDILEIPPADVACHQVAEGETLSDIADQYKVVPVDIAAVAWNELDENELDNEDSLSVGIHLRVPLPVDPESAGKELMQLLTQPVDKSLLPTIVDMNVDLAPASVEIPDSWPFGSGHFRWPTSGWLSQGYHARHRALDIATPLGTVVTAADRGEVIRAGWNFQGYGNLVIVDHKNDFLTLYAHLSEILVEEGQIVSAGEILGEVGSTGNSTGPHLHFEIRDYGKLVDPLVMLTR